MGARPGPGSLRVPAEAPPREPRRWGGGGTVALTALLLSLNLESGTESAGPSPLPLRDSGEPVTVPGPGSQRPVLQVRPASESWAEGAGRGGGPVPRLGHPLLTAALFGPVVLGEQHAWEKK